MTIEKQTGKGRPMNKDVYLFELDSVKKRDEDILMGQKAIYNEIIHNGNRVVVSFNQLTDSRVILSMLESKEKADILMQIFDYGYMKVSRYGEFRTASQYIQHAISKKLSSNQDSFIFSALPVKGNQVYLLAMMKRALRNADLSEITECMNEKSETITEIRDLFREVDNRGYMVDTKLEIEECKNQLALLERFIMLIFKISINKLTVTKAIAYGENSYPKYSLSKFLEIVMSFSQEELNENKKDNKWLEVLYCLEYIRKQLEDEKRRGLRSGLDNRSEWHEKIMELAEFEDKTKNAFSEKCCQMAECVVNICYNYTVEYSIYGVSKHYDAEKLREGQYDSFKQEFDHRFYREWENAKDADKKYLQKEVNCFHSYTGYYPDWEGAIRVLSLRNGKVVRSESKDVANIPIYENNYIKDIKKQKWKNRSGVINAVIGAVFSIIMIALVDNAMSAVQDVVSPLMKSIVILFAFITLNAVIENFFNIPNILDCIKKIGVSIKDLYHMSKERQMSYVNMANTNLDITENLPQKSSYKETESECLKNYLQIWNERPELFIKSPYCEIVNPNTRMDVILNYEIRTGNKIGVVYKSPYYMMVVDLIDDKNGEYHTYERLIPAVPKGGVVVIPKYQNKYILLKQFRHALREEQMAFPRGFGEIDKSGKPIEEAKNALKELEEELGIKVLTEPVYLGRVAADSGIIGSKVAVFEVSISEYKLINGYEGIIDVMSYTKEEIMNAIKDGKITDGFTLAAWAMVSNDEGICSVKLELEK